MHYVEKGGFLVVMGETRPDLFLDDVGFRTIATNYWWWLEPDADLGVRISAPDHPLFDRLSEADLAWHVHGTLALGSMWVTETLARYDGEDGGPIVVDARLGSGRALLTTLDPIYHHGSGFMPATTRFLEGFLPWLAQTVDDRLSGCINLDNGQATPKSRPKGN
ncbi:hypothetical protein I0K15_07710 [Pontivivens ytuae]|uniref:Uncharacterized protein n=2 Tax=Pontivivens ytuae TaxID=2789856 RepID=A0A7S9QDT0_9RHOB|nr:hypothetical protein I0K15_07710 [Pontivivens ytuae]